LLTEEVIKIAIKYLINWVAVLGAGYIWLLIKNVRKDVDHIMKDNAKLNERINKLEDAYVQIKICISRVEQKLSDHEKLCNERYYLKKK